MEDKMVEVLEAEIERLLTKIRGYEVTLAGLQEGYPAAITPRVTEGCAASELKLVRTSNWYALACWYKTGEWLTAYGCETVYPVQWWDLPTGG